MAFFILLSSTQAIQTISSILITAASLSALFLLWLNRRIFFDLFKNISWHSGALLLLLIITFSLLSAFAGFNFKSFIPSDQEWEILEQAKELALGKQVFAHLRYGLFYPLLLSFGFRLFGFNPLVASVMTFVFGILSILLVFALSRAVFKNDKVSLLSSSIYAFTPLVFAFTSLQMGFPAVATFFLLSFLLTTILYFQHHKTSLLALSLLLLVLTSQIKPEYFILIIPFGICFFLFKEYKKVSIPIILGLTIIFLIFSIPYFIKNAQLKEGFKAGWCGAPSQVFYNGEAHSYNLPLTKYLDPVLKFLSNNRFSINYLIYDVPNFVKFWTFRSFIFISILILIGILFSFKKYPKESVFLLLVFFSISFLYMADCAFYETRYVIPTYGLVVIFAGFGLNFMAEKITQFTKKQYLSKTTLLITIFLSLCAYWYFNDYRPCILKGFYRDYMFDNRRAIDDYSRLNDTLKDISPKNSYFFVPQANEEKILIFLGYKAISIGNIEAFHQLDKTDFTTAKLPLDITKNNYFIKSWYCSTLIELKTLCEFVKENYELKLIKQTSYDSLYYFINED
jgi:hypothetical protein